eukprot:2027550-Pyramimonas_sp.AAC.1
MEYLKSRASNGILVSTVDDCRLLNLSRRPFWPSTPGLVTYRMTDPCRIYRTPVTVYPSIRCGGWQII